MMSRAFIVLLLALLLAARPSVAQAQESLTRLTVTFSGEPSDAPYAVCVLAKGSGAVPLDALPSRAGTRLPLGDSPPEFPSTLADRARTTIDEFCKSLKNKQAIQSCGELEARSADAIERAFEALQTGSRSEAPRDDCTGIDEACRPELEVGASTSGWKMTCGLQSRPSAERRVAFIRLAAPSSLNPNADLAVGIRQVQVDGNVVSLELQGALAKGQYLIGSVAGGSYRVDPHSEPTGADGSLRLPLVPRCQAVNIAVPVLTSSLGTVTLKRNDLCLSRESMNLGARDIRVTVPRGAGDYEVELALEKDAFRARWSDDQDPRQIRFQRTGISFSWKRHCYHGSSACPGAVLLGSGIPCQNTPLTGSKSDVCHYHCDAPVESRAVIETPSGVRFTGKNASEEVWTDILGTSGEQLDSYVPSDQRRLRVLEVPRQTLGLDRVRLTTARGDVHELERKATDARSERSIAFPGAGCSDSVRVDFVGGRSFESSVKTTSGGTIALESPRDAVERWSWGGAVHAGVGMMFAEHFRTIDRPWVYGGLLADFHPWEWRWYFEGRLGGILTERRYAMVYDTPHDPNDDEPQRDRVFYVKVPAEALAMLQLGDTEWSIGPMVGLAVGHPLTSSDEDVVGAFDWSLTYGVVANYGLSRAVALEFLVRASSLDEVYTFRSDLRSDVSTDIDWGQLFPPRFLSAGFGFRFGQR
jgi:hypothetical protein